jgi:hypothetical protein
MRVNLTRSALGFAVGVALSASATAEPTLAAAAEKSHHAGFIRYRRAHITVLERAGLESCVCECYAVVKKDLIRLLPDVRHRRQDIATSMA